MLVLRRPQEEHHPPLGREHRRGRGRGAPAGARCGRAGGGARGAGRGARGRSDGLRGADGRRRGRSRAGRRGYKTGASTASPTSRRRASSSSSSAADHGHAESAEGPDLPQGRRSAPTAGRARSEGNEEETLRDPGRGDGAPRRAPALGGARVRRRAAARPPRPRRLTHGRSRSPPRRRWSRLSGAAGDASWALPCRPPAALAGPAGAAVSFRGIVPAAATGGRGAGRRDGGRDDGAEKRV